MYVCILCNLFIVCFGFYVFSGFIKLSDNGILKYNDDKLKWYKFLINLYWLR